MINLLVEIKKWLTAEEELAAFLEGNMLILKKVQVPKLSSLAERRSEEETPLEEISEEVHRYRKEKQSSKKNGTFNTSLKASCGVSPLQI